MIVHCSRRSQESLGLRLGDVGSRRRAPSRTRASSAAAGYEIGGHRQCVRSGHSPGYRDGWADSEEKPVTMHAYALRYVNSEDWAWGLPVLWILRRRTGGPSNSFFMV